ncbi:cytosolic protein [Virgibacillus sp. NKC19-16]|uniref:cytosolic protein n=1 Tax=Virgibacillus salidurans TaxID=2831673 RepID=UPI001F17EAE6|nr:cytosolic protein [Virgibacillus sp. NKC19-16]UJL45032.1 cytosolic protein [Virgibacillus sp. NKC19-16]
MSFRSTINKYFNNHAESSENHEDTSLQTHYYKTTKDKGLSMLENFFTNSEVYEVNSISKEHGEISVLIKKGRKAFIVATVIMVRPYQTAIDFSVTTESVLPFDFGYSTKVIQHLYKAINKDLPLITTRGTS